LTIVGQVTLSRDIYARKELIALKLNYIQENLREKIFDFMGMQ